MKKILISILLTIIFIPSMVFASEYSANFETNKYNYYNIKIYNSSQCSNTTINNIAICIYSNPDDSPYIVCGDGTVATIKVKDEIDKQEYYGAVCRKEKPVEYPVVLESGYDYGNISECKGSNYIKKAVNGVEICIYQKRSTIESDKATCKDSEMETFEKNALTDSKGNYFSIIGCRKAEVEFNPDGLCAKNDVKQAMKIIGYVILVIRWIAPLIIIVLGMVDFGKAAISNDENALKKATGALVRRIVAGVAIFLIPTIILAILNAIEVTQGIENKNDSEFGPCTRCLFDPLNDCEIKKD